MGRARIGGELELGKVDQPEDQGVLHLDLEQLYVPLLGHCRHCPSPSQVAGTLQQGSLGARQGAEDIRFRLVVVQDEGLLGCVDGPQCGAESGEPSGLVRGSELVFQISQSAFTASSDPRVQIQGDKETGHTATACINEILNRLK